MYLANLVREAPSLLVDINVMAALSAGLELSAGSMLIVAAPDVTLGAAVTVYTKSTPAIVNWSCGCGVASKPSTAKDEPV